MAFTRLRNMKTTAELREVESALEQGVSVRAARNSRNLPHAWDDIRSGRRGRDDRSKNHRRN